MPWVILPPDRIADLPLFGIDLVVDQGEYAWYRGSRGRMRVEKAAPRVFFEEIVDAHQCGATAIVIDGEGGKGSAK